MKVVSDASPLINLAAIRQLDLLRRLYRRITVPTAVWDEVVGQGAGKPGAREVEEAQWIRPKAVRNRGSVELLLGELNLGEAEAIVLAQEVGADLLLLDEVRARRAAQRLEVAFIGLVGVLIEAAARGLVADLAGTLAALRDQAGFWLSDEVIAEALRLQRRQH